METTFFESRINSKLIMESLSSLCVKSVFGCQEESLISFYCDRNPKVDYVQLRHEQAAVHAADGYARASGKPGVVLLGTTLGLTNGITGIATAYSDSVPLLIISGPLFPIHSSANTFDDLYISGMATPITKHIFTVEHTEDFPLIIHQAYKLAVNGRPGPVLIDISHKSPPDYSRHHSNHINIEESLFQPKKSENQLYKALEYLESARKPVLLIGGGTIIAGASDVLQEIVQQCQIPVVTTLMGIGAYPTENPLFLGMLGMHGTFAANKAVHQSDLLICIGMRFSDRVTGKISGFSPKSKKIHVDIDPAELNKIIQVDLPIVSDAKGFLEWLSTHLDHKKVKSNTKSWVSEATEWKRNVPRFDKSNSILSPQTVIQMIDQYSDDSTLVVTDVGQHQIWTAHNYKFKNPRTLLTSGGLGTMGYGLPAAIGAAISSPMHQVVCVTGDGSFQMNLQELITAVRYQLPIKVAILNNGYLGMVRQWQQLFFNGRYSSVKISSPNFVKLAESYGAIGFSARTEAEAKKVIREAFKHQGPVLMEFNVVEEENVFPMVPPNHNNHQTLLSSK